MPQASEGRGYAAQGRRFAPRGLAALAEARYARGENRASEARSVSNG